MRVHGMPCGCDHSASWRGLAFTPQPSAVLTNLSTVRMLSAVEEHHVLRSMPAEVNALMHSICTLCITNHVCWLPAVFVHAGTCGSLTHCTSRTSVCGCHNQSLTSWLSVQPPPAPLPCSSWVGAAQRQLMSAASSICPAGPVVLPWWCAALHAGLTWGDPAQRSEDLQGSSAPAFQRVCC